MNLQELLKKYGLEDEKITSLLEEMKTNNIYTASEENMDVRYKKLKDDFDAKDKEHTESLSLIEELKKSSKGNEEALAKISDYEAKITELETENAKIKKDTALKIALQEAGVKNIDYISFKINQELAKDNKALELDDNGHIKGINELIESQKKIEPEFFTSETKKEVVTKEIGGSDKGQGDNEPKNLYEALVNKYNQSENA